MRKFIAKETPAKPPNPPSDIPSSSPAFGTPVHPLKPFSATPAPARHAVLPISLPPAALRPLAFRTFTKKHSLALNSSSLAELAAFVGRHCGSGWREEGLAEKVLEEVARSWKGRNGGVIVDGGSVELKEILTTLEANMSGGKIIAGGRGLSRQNTLVIGSGREAVPLGRSLSRGDSSGSFGVSSLDMEDEIDDESLNDVRKWLKIIDAFEQPRLVYNVEKKHFERDTTKPSILPAAPRKTLAFRNRYNVLHQRLLRHESFHTSAVTTARTSQKKGLAGQQLRITQIANMLGRHGSQQMLLGMLIILPAGELAISDLTGTITLDLARAVDYPENSAWFTPGMIVLVDGIYEEEDEDTGQGLGGTRGVGGILGGKFIASFIGHLSCETRSTSLGMSGPDGGSQDHAIGGGFGWIDFLGLGSERAVGQKMRRVEKRLLRQLTSAEATDRSRTVIIGEVNLDNPRTFPALRKILATYAGEDQEAAPVAFILMGNFIRHPIMARGRGRGSVEYKEYFDELGTVLAEFPQLVRDSTFVFVPGDNDAWVSAGATGAASPIPRKPVPEVFTSRIRRLFTTPNAGDDQSRASPQVVWASNPSRLSLFGPTHELVLFRDDILGRIQRNAVAIGDGMKESGGGKEAASSQGESQTQRDSQSQTQGGEDTMEVDDDAPQDADRASAAAAAAASLRTAQRLVKTVLDQGYLSPFQPSIRPVHWDYAWGLHLYPLPSAMVLMDNTAPAFCVTYGRCHVMNPGSVVVPDRRGVARWVEYKMGSLGQVRECSF
ncbi:related to DNA directed DNA polymerase II chain B [Cephalotrichum gorgonifer]|uniref:DNA polymerase epsilon subunit B n=1 Tax=Cephalotrichum gorgonifer TaxID=2041049 RepID=A0AAE8SZ49_9PEZI|nr:related to DNA directed DNA polymerase II chain B [Cephalotrichum gorgonifer]